MAARSTIQHGAHHHSLTLVATGQAKFECSGCLEPGTGGDRYTCLQGSCVFNLHKDCALAQPTLEHLLLPESKFDLYFEAPRSKQLCDACGTRVQGIHYHCDKTELDLHPCCAKLPLEIPLRELTFELRKEASHRDRCAVCRGRGGYMTFWFYRSICKTQYLHVRCVKQEVFRLTAGAGSQVDDDSMLVRFVKEMRRPGTLERTCHIIAAAARIIFALISGDPGTAIDVAQNAVIGLLSNSTG